MGIPGMIIGRGNPKYSEKLYPVSVYPPKMPCGFPWD
jgi:hypothetical protein